MLSLLALPATVLALIGQSSALPTKRQAPAAGVAATAVFQEDFPDPSMLKNEDGWFAFATSGNGLNIQMATSKDFNSWSYQAGHDALPNLPAWVHIPNPKVWAPDVFRRDDGQYVMYFSALNTPSAGEPDSIVHCIGVATSSNPEGPYTSGSDKPLICPIAQGGAIDASHFKDDDGSVYMTYKIDGNAIGSGGSCGNTDAPIVPTPIMLQKVAADGFTLQGPPTTILDRDSADGPLVEAPSIAKKGGQYYLFFSSNCWSSEQYDTSFAIASSIAGPYTKSGPLLVTGDNGLTSPGGADVSADGQHIIFHANFADGRTMYAADLGSVTAGSSGVKFVSK